MMSNIKSKFHNFIGNQVCIAMIFTKYFPNKFSLQEIPILVLDEDPYSCSLVDYGCDAETLNHSVIDFSFLAAHLAKVGSLREHIGQFSRDHTFTFWIYINNFTYSNSFSMYQTPYESPKSFQDLIRSLFQLLLVSARHGCPLTFNI